MEKPWLDEDAKRLMASLKEIALAQWSGYYSFEVLDHEIIGAALAYLEKRRRSFTAKDIIASVDHNKSRNTIGYTFFFREILPKIFVFARTDDEADALVMILLEEMLAVIAQPIYETMKKKGLMPRNINMCEIDS
jgi:hypothetical protein